MGLDKEKELPPVERLISKLERDFGLTPLLQQKIGVLVLAWGQFESSLEIAIWTITEEDPTATRPTTDGFPVSNWIKRFREGAARHHPRLAELAAVVCDAADDLLVFRNAIMHGWMASPAVGGPAFINNPNWSYTIRKRSPTEAHISERTLDLAIECADLIYNGVHTITSAAIHPIMFDQLLPTDFVARCRKAGSIAHELRHLTAMMNSEKY